MHMMRSMRLLIPSISLQSEASLRWNCWWILERRSGWIKLLAMLEASMNLYSYHILRFVQLLCHIFAYGPYGSLWDLMGHQGFSTVWICLDLVL